MVIPAHDSHNLQCKLQLCYLIHVTKKLPTWFWKLKFANPNCIQCKNLLDVICCMCCFVDQAQTDIIGSYYEVDWRLVVVK